MDSSLAAGFVALGLCIPLIGVVFAFRIMRLMSLFGGNGRGPGNKRRKPPPPLGGNPYHLP